MTEIITVLGAGYAGCAAVLHLEEKLPEDAKLVWVSEASHHFVLHKAHELIRDPRKERDYVIPVNEIKDEDTQFVNGTVSRVDEDEVELDSGNTVPYDHLIVALGSQTADYGIPGVKEHGLPLKGRADAIEIHRSVRDALTDASADDPAEVVIGGAGLSGVQAAGEIAELRDEHNAPVNITLVEALNSVLPNSDEGLQSKVAELLDKQDIDVKTGTPVDSVTESEIHFADSDPITYDVFVWTGGITGPDALDGSELETEDGRATADTTLRTSVDGVFAIGDAAVIDDNGPIPPTAQAARQAGKVAAVNVVNSIRGEPLVEWEYTDRGTLVSVGDAVVAHNVPYSPFNTFGGRTARMMKRGVTKAWVKSLTGNVQFFDLLPTPMQAGEIKSDHSS